MYKNFKLTDDERKEIMESHKAHGYKKPINELGDKEIGLVRGNPDLKLKKGRPAGDYSVERAAAKQFQQDFKRDFFDPAIEYPNPWDKDQAMPSGNAPSDTLSDKSLSRFYSDPKMNKVSSEPEMKDREVKLDPSVYKDFTSEEMYKIHSLFHYFYVNDLVSKETSSEVGKLLYQIQNEMNDRYWKKM